ncbi:hypothetical protein AKJ16_DCAP13019 [Drosera capensis]
MMRSKLYEDLVVDGFRRGFSDGVDIEIMNICDGILPLASKTFFDMFNAVRISIDELNPKRRRVVALEQINVSRIRKEHSIHQLTDSVNMNSPSQAQLIASTSSANDGDEYGQNPFNGAGFSWYVEYLSWEVSCKT